MISTIILTLIIISILLSAFIIKPFFTFLLEYNFKKPKIELRSSYVHNRGIFANEYIQKGTIIEEFPLISYILTDNIDQTILKDYVISMPTQFNNNNPSNCSIMLGFGSIYNHSDDNNAEWSFISHDKMIVTAIKDIFPGQEIFVSYGKNYWDSRNNLNKK